MAAQPSLLTSVEELPEQPFIFDIAFQKSRKPLQKTGGNPKTRTRKDLEVEDAAEEVGNRVYELTVRAAKDIYHELLEGRDVLGFLKSEDSGYDPGSEAWVNLPRNPEHESQICVSFAKIINDVINHFYPSPPASTTREAVDSHNIPMVHDNGVHFTMPGVCIKANGPSFESPEHKLPKGVGYTNVTAVAEVKLHEQLGMRVVHCKRLAVYHRQIFIQQPNRHFVRSLVFTERMFRLVHHDCSGMYATRLFDVHKEASLLVQFIIGLASPNETDVGLDTSVQWTVDEPTGKKVSGTIAMNQHDDSTQTSTLKTYDLDMTVPPFVRPGIFGRGTVGWHATDPSTGLPVIIKDAWRTDSRNPESGYLLEAKGIPGVVEMLGYQDYCAQTGYFRPAGFHIEEFTDRFMLRVVVKKYGEPIWFFRSRLQLVCALRDAFVGHRALFEREIIHRDISVLNILMGVDGAAEGYRGILIDLDMAAYTAGGNSCLPSDPATGTRTFQSMNVVQGCSLTPQPPQNYLDELESFFYVYCYILHAFKKPGDPVTALVNPVKFWDTDDLEMNAIGKGAFGLCLSDTRVIAAYWKGACTNLMRDFHDVVRDVMQDKNTIDSDRVLDDEAKLDAYDVLAHDTHVHFNRVKAAFDKAIEALEKEGPNAQELEPYPRSFLPPHLVPNVPGTPPAAPTCDTPPPISPQPAGETQDAAKSNPTTGKKRPSEDSEVVVTPRKRVRNTLSTGDQSYETRSCQGNQGTPSDDNTVSSATTSDKTNST